MGQSLAREVGLPSETLPGARLEAGADGCPRLRDSGSLLLLNGQVALGYLDVGYRPIPLIQHEKGSWVWAVPWKPFQHRAPTREDIVSWWMRRPDACIALVCGRKAGLIFLDVDPRHGGVDPQLSAPGCSTPREGIHSYFAAPESIPELDSPGLEWLGDGHIARVPPTPGYRGLNGGLPPRKACYQPGQLPLELRPRRPLAPVLATFAQGNPCDVLTQALGRQIGPGSTITCFCRHDNVPSLAIYPDHAYCFSQKRRFSPRQVLEGLGLAHLFHIFHIEVRRQLNEANVQEGGRGGEEGRVIEETKRRAQGVARNQEWWCKEGG